MTEPVKVPKCTNMRLLPWTMAELGNPKMQEFLKFNIRSACSDGVSDVAILNIIAKIMRGGIQCWKMQGTDENGEVWDVGFVSTELLNDPLMGIKSLKIGAANIYGGFEDSLWKDAFSDIVKCAKGEKCDIIQTDIVNLALVDRMEALGFQESCRTYVKEV